MRDTRGERSAKGNEGIKGHRRRRRLDRAAVDVVVCGLVVVVVRRSRRVTADASPGRVTAQNIPLRHHRSRPASAIIVIISDDTTDERSSTIPPVQRAKFLSKHGHVTSGQHRL